MPRVRTTKDTTIAFRVTPRIGELVAQVASSEGLNTSEWLRNLVIAELKRRGLLPMTTLSLEVEGKRGGGKR
ncbi:hypothetical protein DRO58_07965 [Candidatus Bathyarchaeota archaeon]|nr:MAG: hypothetical protein DRO58_07965 [Candidatus Bathyarchaeota archaeon]